MFKHLVYKFLFESYFFRSLNVTGGHANGESLRGFPIGIYDYSFHSFHRYRWLPSQSIHKGVVFPLNGKPLQKHLQIFSLFLLFLWKGRKGSFYKCFNSVTNILNLKENTLTKLPDWKSKKPVFVLGILQQASRHLHMMYPAF